MDDDWAPDGPTNFHETFVGELRVGVSRDDGGDDKRVLIMPPVMPEDGLMCDPAYARNLAADLIAAAHVAERITGGTAVTPSPIARALVERNPAAARRLVAELVELLAGEGGRVAHSVSASLSVHRD